VAYRDKEQQGASGRRELILTASQLSGFLGTECCGTRCAKVKSRNKEFTSSCFLKKTKHIFMQFSTCIPCSKVLFLFLEVSKPKKPVDLATLACETGPFGAVPYSISLVHL
jgi:hypothetical protein